MAPVNLNRLGSVCHEWDYKAKKCGQKIDVWQLPGTKSAHFLSKLAVDADGAPRAYHPSDQKPKQNSAKAYDWLANLSTSDRHGIQGQDAVGPAAGFYVSGTSIQNPSITNLKDVRRYVDASVVPYIVLPKNVFPVPQGSTLKDGCVAFVVDTTTGGSTGAIFADVGRAVGESSIALAWRLGLDPFYSSMRPKVKGFGGKRFFYLVFPDVAVAPPWPVGTIQSTATNQFNAWGGEAVLKSLLPSLPALKPPVTTPVPWP